MSINKNPESWQSCTHEYRVRIEQDTDCENPRESWDHVGKMVCWHRRYALGDVQPKGEPFEWTRAMAQNCVADNYPESLLAANEEKLIKANYFILPLNLYDHSGLSMSTSKTYPFDCPWDAGQVGWIYISKKQAATEWPGTKKETQEKALECLSGEVEEYTAYLEGNVWGFIIERKPLSWQDDTDYMYKQLSTDKDVEWEEVESAWGFFGEVYAGAYSPDYYIKADLAEKIKDELEDEANLVNLFANGMAFV